MSDKKADRVHELPPGPSVGKKPDLIRPDLPPGWDRQNIGWLVRRGLRLVAMTRRASLDVARK